MSLPVIQTPLLQVEWPGRRPVWVKDEGACPTRTFKDRLGWRLAELLERDASRQLLVSCITLGNTAVSIAAAFEAAFAPATRPQIFAIFPQGFSERVIGPDTSSKSMLGKDLLTALRRQQVRCLEHDLSGGYLEDRAIGSLAEGIGVSFERHLDVSRGLTVPCYEHIVAEAYRELGHLPDVIVVPVGAGVLFNETIGYVESHAISSRVLGVATTEEHSIADKLYSLYSPYHTALKEGYPASHPVHKRHPVTAVKDDAIRGALLRLSSTLQAEPSAAAVFAILDDSTLIDKSETVLVISTGNGVVA